MTTDNLYTTSIAHRSIARAALHLGIEGIETKALEALGGVLVDYLDRVCLISSPCFALLRVVFHDGVAVIASFCLQ